MYLLEFVNLVRGAQGYDALESLPVSRDRVTSPLELAMGCRLQAGLMRFSSPTTAQAVAATCSLPLGVDGVTVAVPAALDTHASVIETARTVHGQNLHPEAV